MFLWSVFFEKMTKTTFAINRQHHLKQQRNEMAKFGESSAGFFKYKIVPLSRDANLKTIFFYADIIMMSPTLL